MKFYFQELLAKAFRSYGESIALEYGEKRITYAQVERKAFGVSRWIAGRGIEKGTFIGISMENKVDFISVLIGILNAGCVFVPLDTELPFARVRKMIESTGTRLVFTGPSIPHYLRGNMPDAVPNVTCVPVDDSFYGEEYRNRNAPLSPLADYSPQDPIYIYFTSGSTGEPKAVLGQNKSLRHFIEWEIETFGLDNTIRVSQFITVDFDAFLRDLFVSLCAGGTLCIPETREILSDGPGLTRWIEENDIHVIHCVPSLFKKFGTDTLTPSSYKNLKYVFLSGEPLTSQHLTRWYNTMGERVRLVNFYGPTETTMIKSFHLVQENDLGKKKIPIGKPMKGARFILFDNAMKICDQGVVGEIYIRTPFRTLGYYNDPLNNAQRFIPNPITGDADDLFYKTGDLGVELPDGSFEFLERIDRQVKIQGVRIELEEIETLLRRHPAVRDAVAVVIDNDESEKTLCVCFTAREHIPVPALREYLFENLPGYMMPSTILRLDDIPLLTNGKIDRISLEKILSRSKRNTRYQPPRNSIEKQLAVIWSKILKKEKIGVYDDFFEVGGHSLEMVSLASEVDKAFGVELIPTQVFKSPTIEEMARFLQGDIPGKSPTPEIEEVFTLLNEPKIGKLFLFPPQIGYGLVYKPLADFIRDYALYAFNFIETEDRLERYAHQIMALQPGGGILLFGYSTGGNLAFDVAKTLEQKGCALSGIIILDSFSKEIPLMLGSDEDKQEFFKMMEQDVENMGIGYLKDKIIRKSQSYTLYHERSATRGAIDAPIHLIVSEDREERKKQLVPAGPATGGTIENTDWENFSRKRCIIYKGFGNHMQMFAPQHIKKNIKIIKRILEENKK